MAQVQYDPENDYVERAARLKAAARMGILSEASTQRQIRAKRREATKERRIEMLVREAATARAIILGRKKARDEARDRAIAGQIASTIPISAIERIELRAMKVFHLTRTEIRGGSRQKFIAFARQFIMYWSRRLTQHSYPRIGRLLGARDHTTIFHGCKAYVNKRRAMKRYLRPAR